MRSRNGSALRRCVRALRPPSRRPVTSPAAATVAAAADSREEQRHKLRSEPPPSDATVVARGGPDTATKLQGHARRTHRAWSLDGEPLFGVSVFCALDADGPASLDGLLAGRLRTYRVVHQCQAGDLLAAGFALLPTAGRPHYTVVLASDGEGEVGRLLARLGPPRDNPYHPANARRERREP